MMKKLLLLGVIIFSVSMSYGQQIAKGYVFDDINRNGKKEKNEKGIAGVSVSNGRDVVLTDEKGYYELPAGNDNIIFVIKPAGYQLPVNEYNQPVFYYIHKPMGSPDENYAYKGVAPTGKLPKSIDFALFSYNEPETFTSLIYGDPQPYTLEELDYFRRGIVEETKKLKNMVFGLSLGDLVGDTLRLHQPYIEVVKENGIPWFNVMGNHDMNYEATTDSLSDESFEARFGPANYAFNYGKAHIIVLDDILYPDPRAKEKYWGGFRADQLAFLENDLKQVSKDQLVILAFHIPMFTEGNDSFRESDRKQVFKLLEQYPNVLMMSAHTHYQLQYFHGIKDGCNRSEPIHEFNVGTTSGDWYSGQFNENGIPVSTMRDGTPKGYVLLHIDGNNYKFDYKVAGQPEDYQIRLYNSKVLQKGRRNYASLYANFFIGSENDKVEYRIDGGEWREMRKVQYIDPEFMYQVQEFDYADGLLSGRRPSNPVKCEHLWNGYLPSRLEEGEHTIEVRATDMFGRTHQANSSYRIVSAN